MRHAPADAPAAGQVRPQFGGADLLGVAIGASGSPVNLLPLPRQAGRACSDKLPEAAPRFWPAASPPIAPAGREQTSPTKSPSRQTIPEKSAARCSCALLSRLRADRLFPAATSTAAIEQQGEIQHKRDRAQRQQQRFQHAQAQTHIEPLMTDTKELAGFCNSTPCQTPATSSEK